MKKLTIQLERYLEPFDLTPYHATEEQQFKRSIPTLLQFVCTSSICTANIMTAHDWATIGINAVVFGVLTHDARKLRQNYKDSFEKWFQAFHADPSFDEKRPIVIDTKNPSADPDTTYRMAKHCINWAGINATFGVMASSVAYLGNYVSHNKNADCGMGNMVMGYFIPPIASSLVTAFNLFRKKWSAHEAPTRHVDSREEAVDAEVLPIRVRSNTIATSTSTRPAAVPT